MDLLSYLQTYEPSNLQRVAGNVYCTREHDSLKISNGKWYWWSRGFGGVSALLSYQSQGVFLCGSGTDHHRTMRRLETAALCSKER